MSERQRANHQRSPGCEDRHASLATELRAVVLLAAERLGPLLERAREGAPATGEACASCPVCAVLAVARGERSELAVRWAEQAAGLLAVLRTALAEGDPVAWAARPGAAPDPESAPPADLAARRVQRIPVERPAPAPSRAAR